MVLSWYLYPSPGVMSLLKTQTAALGELKWGSLQPRPD